MDTAIQTIIDEVLKNPFLIVFILWVALWKGLALWHASGRNQPWWFFIILIINTFGIVEIIYLFMVLHLRINQLFRRHSVIGEEYSES